MTIAVMHTPGLAFAQERQGTIRIGTLGLDTADPHRHTGSIGVQQVYVEALTSIGRDGSVEPWLAGSIDVSEDGLNYTFKLRPDVKFHNGDVLKASDIVANIERVRKEIKGGWLVSAMGYVDKVEAPDDLTVVITMQNAYAPLLNLMSELWIVSPRSDGWDGTITRPIGTGPFTFDTWRPKDSFTGNAFGDYWVPGLPKVASVWFDLRDQADKALALQRGDLHIAVVSVEAAETIKQANIASLAPLGDANWFSVAFNNRTPRAPFDDIRVRQALAHAIDKAAFMEFEGGEHGVVTNQMTPPGNFYFDQAMHDADPYRAPDLEKAKALLAEAGVNPVEHTIRFVSWQEDYAQVIVQMLRQLGFQIDHAALDDVGAQQRLGGDDWDMNVMCSPRKMKPSNFFSKCCGSGGTGDTDPGPPRDMRMRPGLIDAVACVRNCRGRAAYGASISAPDPGLSANDAGCLNVLETHERALRHHPHRPRSRSRPHRGADPARFQAFRQAGCLPGGTCARNLLY
ncbi:ABC-type transport system substrate-binding protein [Shinella granuli]|uniref:ABC-type transport system substrate-binding protein n=1 Tax=Shinella granuli TaxID=323621 RepID=A0A4R2C5C8_SHIGR|nr:ABC-type transport system substrate-binding protein [Shinella granuli]